METQEQRNLRLEMEGESNEYRKSADAEQSRLAELSTQGKYIDGVPAYKFTRAQKRKANKKKIKIGSYSKR